MTGLQPIDLASRLDAAHLSVLNALPADLLDLSDIPATRANFATLLEALPQPPMPSDVTIEDVHVPGADGDPDVMVRLYRPDGMERPGPALYWIHGGGMVLGSVAGSDYECAARASKLSCIVASVEYRLAPEHPYPAPMNDCYVGISWLAENAEELGIDPGRVVLGGASAGGGLAAGVALMARDRGGPDICYQLLVFPMLDHRNTTASSQVITDPRVWNRDANVAGWAAYLGEVDPVPIYASPSLAEDLAGLPPAYINVGEFDLFLDEDVAYAMALTRAGVATELHVYPGAFHGSNGLVSRSPLSVRWRADETAALTRALHPIA